MHLPGRVQLLTLPAVGAAEPAPPCSHKTLKYALKDADFAAVLNPGLVPAQLKLQSNP